MPTNFFGLSPYLVLLFCWLFTPYEFRILSPFMLFYNPLWGNQNILGCSWGEMLFIIRGEEVVDPPAVHNVQWSGPKEERVIEECWDPTKEQTQTHWVLAKSFRQQLPAQPTPHLDKNSASLIGEHSWTPSQAIFSGKFFLLCWWSLWLRLVIFTWSRGWPLLHRISKLIHFFWLLVIHSPPYWYKKKFFLFNLISAVH